MTVAKAALSLFTPQVSKFVKGVRELAKEGDEWATGVLRQIGAVGSKTVKTQGTAREVGRGTPGTIIKKDPKAPGGSRMARGKKAALKKRLQNEQRALTRSGALKVGGTAAAGAAVPVVTRKIQSVKEKAKAAAEKEKKAKAEAERKATAKRRGESTAAARAAAREGAKKTEPKRKRRLILGKDAKIRPFGGVIARALFGEDEDFGKERGAIDFVRRRKPKKKNMGGEVKKYRGGGTVKARNDLSRAMKEQQRAMRQRSAAPGGVQLPQPMPTSPRRRPSPQPPPSAPGMRGSGMGLGMKKGGMAKKQSANARKSSRPQSAGAAKRGWGAAIR